MTNFWLFVTNVFVVGMIILLILKKVDILELLAKLVFYFFGEYILLSAGLFIIDKFRVDRVQVAMLLINLVLLGYLYYLNKIKDNYDLELLKPKQPIFVLILVAATIFSFNKFEFFGMGQDEGVYQTKAIQLAYGDVDRQFDFDEYGLLDSESLQAQYWDFTDKLGGLNNYNSENPLLNQEEELSDVSGIFHGIPTFPAILALAISSFGLDNILVFQTVFLITFAIMVLKICENLKFSKVVTAIILIATAMSPIILWVSKSALTEMFLTFDIAVLVYYLTKPGDGNILKSTIPICIFSFFHISIYTVMPEIIIMYWLLFLSTRKYQYLYANFLSLLFFTAGYLFMLYISPNYSFGNSEQIYFGVLNDWILIPVMLAVVTGCLILNYLLVKFGNKIRFDLPENKSVKWLIVGSVIIMVGYMAYYAYSISSGRIEPDGSFKWYYGNIMSIKYISLVAFGYLSGLVLFPVALFYLVKHPSIVQKDIRYATIAFMFIYNVLFTASFFKKEVFFYYYYARYFAPFIILVTLLFGIYSKKLPRTVQKIILILVICFNCVYGYAMIENDDDSLMSYDIIEEVAGEIMQDSAVIIANDELSRLFALPLKSMAGVSVFPIFDSDIEETVDVVAKSYDRVYLLSNKSFDDLNQTLIYINDYISSQDDNRQRFDIIPLPKEFYKANTEIVLAKLQTPRLKYSLLNSDVVQSGFGGIEAGYRWTNAGESTVDTYLNIDSYNMIISQLPLIPFDRLNTDEIAIKIYFNGIFIDDYTVNQANMAAPISVYIDNSVVNQGNNTVKLVIDTWSPADYGSADQRDLGLAITTIEFIPI